jgi:hypothetical protein
MVETGRLGRSARAAAIVATAAACFSVSARAQDRIWYADGDESNANFGNWFDISDDFDGDGLHELLIGAPGTICTIQGDGTATLWSTSDGELKRWCGSQEELGASVSVIADVDGDGLQDVLVGSPAWNNPKVSPQSGRCFVFSSASGATLLEVDGTEPYGVLGAAVAGLPDLNGDGLPEFLVGQPHYADSSPYQAGRVFVCSSKDGSVLRTYIGEHDGDNMGITLAALGDVDADGVKDYGITAPYNSNSLGKVYVYSGATGALLQSWKGNSKYIGDRLGTSIADAGDLDGDGHADVLCGGITGPKKIFGHVDAYSGATGAMIWTIQDGTYVNQEFGYSCAMAGDMNGDGFEEILVGAIADRHDGTDAGRVDVFSGRTRRVLYHYYPGTSFAQFGARVMGRTDWNRDKIPDIVVGAPLTDNTWQGRVSIFAGNDLFFQADVTNPAPNTNVTLNVRGGPAGALVMTVVVDVDGSPAWDTITLTTLDANGELADVENVPPEVSGHDFTLIGYAINAKGKLIDTSTEDISVQ